MTEALKIYDFNIYSRIIRQSIENTKWLITDPNQRDIIKEEGIHLLTILCFNYPNLMTLNDIPFQVFEWFKYILRIIKVMLIGLCQLISDMQNLDRFIVKQNIFDFQILKRLNIIIANFGNKKQCFEFIKIPFLSCSITLCFIAYNWNINRQFCLFYLHRNDNDFMRLCEFCTIKLEKDILEVAQKDHTLKSFFQKFHQKSNFQITYLEVHQLAYPFQYLALTTKILQEFNVDVLQALSRCLDFQLQNNTVQRHLVKCLINIFKETNTILDEQLRKKMFQYIFEMNYIGNSNQGCIREILILALNNSANDQSMDQSIFEAMGDKYHKKYPETCHLLELMEYLQEKQDLFSQKVLMQLIENYLTYNGSIKYIEECQYELMKFKEGMQMLTRLGFQIQLMEQSQYFEEVYQI